MKRFVVCGLITAGLLAAGQWSFSHLTNVRDEVLAEVDAITELAQSGEPELALERALALTELWEDREHAMMAFIRHGELDEVTLSLAKLPAYLRHEDLAAFSAEADTVRRILWHIWESERFSLVNIL